MLTEQEIGGLTAEERQFYEGSSAYERTQFTQAYRDANGHKEAQAGVSRPVSAMKLFGIGGTFLSLAGVVMIGLTSGNMLWLTILASVFGLSNFLWMIGAIESRLIDINETLKAQSVKPRQRSNG